MKTSSILILLSILPVSGKSQTLGCDPVKFEFNRIEWSFPSNAKTAFNKHKLSYKPPGYYYSEDSNQVVAILDYHYQPLDFDNEYQPKEVLFPRHLHSYIFQIPERETTYDSLQTALEQLFNKKFVLTKGLKEYSSTLREEERPFEFNFLTVDSCFTVGIKRSLSSDRKKIVTVRFMYGLSLGYMGIVMGGY
jgi:hypothetical protein